MNYAIVENGVVVNTIVWNGQTDWTPPFGTTVVQIPVGEYVGIGSMYDAATGKFGPPPQPPTAIGI